MLSNNGEFAIMGFAILAVFMLIGIFAGNRNAQSPDAIQNYVNGNSNRSDILVWSGVGMILATAAYMIGTTLMAV